MSIEQLILLRLIIVSGNLQASITMKKIPLVSFLVIGSILKVNAQYVSHYSLSDNIKKDTLTDSSGNHYVVDKERIYVTGYDSTYRQMWKTDPYKDNKIPEYRTARPRLVMFKLAIYEGKEQLCLKYSNTQFGTLSKGAGKYHWLGQD